MIVDAREILFIRQNAPHGMLRTLSNNLHKDYASVRSEFYSLREAYDEELVIEARRLLKENTGLQYTPAQAVAEEIKAEDK